MSDVLTAHLGSAAAAGDLEKLVKRIRSVEKSSAVRLQAVGSSLAVSVCTLAPETLLDSTPTVLGMRAFRLEEPAEFDVVVESAAILDRLARIEEENFVLKVPPTTVHAVWAGVQPPMSGWEEVQPLPVELLESAAKEGMDAVDSALPDNPGHAVVNTVRSRIWSSPLQIEQRGGAVDSQPTDFPVPTGAAFAAVVLGFLPRGAQGSLRCFTSGSWLRINAPAGYVLVRRNSAL